eukprot:CAMPEP_0119561694 /NCGR_PEP_ID=MMETSP1352-20130426/18358_1 /TAXON_ID=265584 /ORGANISM="Stauroneis constricta, Strain CCMP1120" /LENGTH=460 /DNA_ID=CAMNT_0007609951 /DNA_START=55 /DNA_END=1437 /DNA_ORIENTATION=+
MNAAVQSKASETIAVVPTNTVLASAVAATTAPPSARATAQVVARPPPTMTATAAPTPPTTTSIYVPAASSLSAAAAAAPVAKPPSAGSAAAPAPSSYESITPPLPSSASSVASNSSTSKRALMTTNSNGEPLSEKRLRRLEKNRQSARECRRRKREATENLEREINVLEGENLKLRLQLQIGEEAQESSEVEQKRLTESLDALLKSGASESEIFAKIEEYKEKFADYGRDRRSAIEFHLRNIERLLMPTQTTSVVLATLQGGAQADQATASGQSAQSQSQTPVAGVRNSGASQRTAPVASASHNPSPHAAIPASAQAAAAPTATNPIAINGTHTPSAPGTAAAPPKNQSQFDRKSLFQFLVQTLEVSPEQAAALKDSRFVAQEMDECLQSSLAVLKELSSRLTQCGEDLDTEFSNIRSILTPTQAAKFLVWVANNNACMYMLNELWQKVYSQTSAVTDGA